MYLVDTNIWLERLLDQERCGEVIDFLEKTSSDLLSMTDFAFHSIALALDRLNEIGTLSRFVKDAFVNGSVSVIHLEPQDTEELINVKDRYGLDFDDAYQYVAAEKYSLTIVSFDGDYDRTDLGRKTPADVLKGSSRK